MPKKAKKGRKKAEKKAEKKAKKGQKKYDTRMPQVCQKDATMVFTELFWKNHATLTVLIECYAWCQLS